MDMQCAGELRATFFWWWPLWAANDERVGREDYRGSRPRLRLRLKVADLSSEGGSQDLPHRRQRLGRNACPPVASWSETGL